MANENVTSGRFPRGRAVLWVLAPLFLLSAVALVWFVAITPYVQEGVARGKCSIKGLTRLMVDRRPTEGWPACNGKNFVLALVARGHIDVTTPENRHFLFCLADPERSEERVADHRWQEITMDALRSGEDFSGCTSYRGRRNTDHACGIPPSTDGPPVPILLCPHHEDGVYVGYSDGSVRFLHPEDAADALAIAEAVSCVSD